MIAKSWREVIVSDIHFGKCDRQLWAAFRAWVDFVRPEGVTFLGDVFDFGAISRYLLESGAQPRVIPEIKEGVGEINWVANRVERVRFMEGNHEARWRKYVLGNCPLALDGAIGLSLREQCYAQGLNEDVEWRTEDVTDHGIKCGPFLLRHGHVQSGRFGGGKHVCATRLAKGNGVSQVFGHHHRAQLFCQTANGVHAIAIANPCITPDHDYAGSTPDWQQGFTVLELFGDDLQHCTPHLVIATGGRFAWGGRVYG